MAQLGADVEALDVLSVKFKDASAQLMDIVSQISSQVQGAWWLGADADKFRSDWEGSFKTQLQTVSQTLESTGTSVKQQAEQQRATSNA